MRPQHHHNDKRVKSLNAPGICLPLVNTYQTASLAREICCIMDTATRLLAGYASLRTSDSDLPEKGSSQMTDDGIKAPVLYRRPNSWLGAPTLLVIHGLILIANLTVAISYNVWSTSVCSHGPQNQNCTYPLLILCSLIYYTYTT